MTKKRQSPTKQAPVTSVALPDNAEWEKTFAGLVEHFEKQHERPALFPLGLVVVSSGAREFMERNAITAAELLELHQSGEWDDCDGNLPANLLALRPSLRAFSVYRYGPAQEAIVVVTTHEGEDGVVTTISLPSEVDELSRPGEAASCNGRD